MSLSLRLAWRYLAGRRLRTGLTFAAIVLAVMITVAMQGILPAVKASFDANMAASVHAVNLVLRRADGGAFDEAVAADVAAVPGVAVLTPVLERPLRLPDAMRLATRDGAAITTLVLNGVDPATAEATIPIRPVAGRWLMPGDDRAVMVRASLARDTGLGVGDVLQLPGGAFTIVGVLPERPVAGDEEITLPLAAAQALLGTPGTINAITAQFGEGEDEAALREAIVGELGPAYSAGSVSAGGDAWRTALSLGEWAFALFGVLAMAMAGFIMLNTFRTSVAERRRDIAMLRAVGASQRTVMGLLVAEGLLLGGLGTLVGMAAGALLVAGLVQLLSPVWERVVGAPLGAPTFGLRTTLLAAGPGIAVPLLAVVLPALAARRVSPLEALRPQAAVADSGPARSRMIAGAALLLAGVLALFSADARLATGGALLLLASLTLLSPALVAPLAGGPGWLLTRALPGEGALAQRNLRRNPGRAAITASAMMISLAILVALAGLTTTFTRGLLGYLEQSMRADYLILPEALVLGQGGVTAGPELAERVRGVAGVADVTTLRRSGATVGDAEVQVIGIEPSGYTRLAGLVFTSGDEGAYEQLAAGDAIVVNGILARQAGLEVGQRVALETPGGRRSYEVVAIGIDYLNARQATAYLSQAELAAAFGQERDVLLLVNRAADAEAEAVEAALREAIAEAPAFSLLVFAEWREAQVAGNQARSAILYGLMLLLALPSLIALANTLGVNVLERTRELGVLRALGATRAQVRRIILAESLLLAGLGVGGGLLAGLGLGYALVGAITQSGLVFAYTFPLGGVLLTVAVGLGCGVLAALVPARRAARMDIVAALQYE